jgi:1,4-alpha-glucan branching enzyme
MQLNSDDVQYRGFGRVQDDAPYVTQFDPLYEADDKGWLKLYLPARTVLVLKRKPLPKELKRTKGKDDAE